MPGISPSSRDLNARGAHWLLDNLADHPVLPTVTQLFSHPGMFLAANPWPALLLAAASLFAVPMTALATEPLHDRLTVGSETGVIFPDPCCWIDLPESERLREARRQERGCTAIGGPVGEYRLEGDRLWLVGLRTCGGTPPLQSIYPDLPDPAPADLVNGKVRARLGWLCRGEDGIFVYRRDLTLQIERGRVVSTEEETFNETGCPSTN